MQAGKRDLEVKPGQLTLRLFGFRMFENITCQTNPEYSKGQLFKFKIRTEETLPYLDPWHPNIEVSTFNIEISSISQLFNIIFKL